MSRGLEGLGISEWGRGDGVLGIHIMCLAKTRIPAYMSTSVTVLFLAILSEGLFMLTNVIQQLGTSMLS